MIILIKVTFSFKQGRKISGFLWNILDTSIGSTKAMLTQRQRNFKLFNPNPTQAMLEKQLEEQHRQGAAVQPYLAIT